MAYELNYKPDGDILKAFIKDRSFVSGLQGPVGSGKSVGACIKSFLIAAEQAPDRSQIRRSRGVCVRNTNPQLRTTAIKTWLDWFPEDVFGKFNWNPPYTHKVRIHDIELEMLFLALDTPNDVKKLLSLELTFGWVNEAREIPKTIIDALTMRVNRFPSKKDGGATWAGIFMDTNAPDETHWWPIMAGAVPVPGHISPEEAKMLVKPKGWKFFNQPSGMLRVKDAQGTTQGYVPNPLAENKSNMPADYYERIIEGKTASWIDVYVLNKLATLADGKPVYPTFNGAVHVAKNNIEPIPGKLLHIGIDFGLTPAAVIAQKDAHGRWLILQELVCVDMGMLRFGELMRQELRSTYPKADFPYQKITGDPAGNQRAQTDETTPFQILRASGVVAHPAPSNDPDLRQQAVESTLNKMAYGLSGILVDPRCKTLIQGFEGGYHFKRLNVASMDRYSPEPDKNRYSHIHDALQYLMLGAGEGRAITTGANPAKPTRASYQWDPLNSSPPKRRVVMGTVL